MIVDERIRAIVREELAALLADGQPVVVPAGPSPRELRERTGVSIEDLAAKAGVCAGTIRRIEGGRFSRFPFQTVWKIAGACGLDLTLYAHSVKEEFRRKTGRAA